MQEKIWIEIFEELGLNTDIFDDEKWDKMVKTQMEYRFIFQIRNGRNN